MKKVVAVSFRFIKRSVKTLAMRFGYSVEILAFPLNVSKNTSMLNLNVGAGRQVIEGFKSLDFYSESYYSDKKKFLKSRIEYDIRGGTMPYGTGSVDNIYISHVIEHIEPEFVELFVNQAFDRLKLGGVLRIACPDGKFLFNVSQFNNEYWNWRRETFSRHSRLDINGSSTEQYNFLIREMSTPRCRFYNNQIEAKVISLSEVKKMDYEEFKSSVNNKMSFRPEHASEHITMWDFDDLNTLGRRVGFSKIIESKPNGSVSSVMQSKVFDTTFPQMSLYVDMVN